MGDAMIDRGVHDSRPRDEAAARAEVLVDAGKYVADAELLAVAREDSFPERRIVGDAVSAVEATRALERAAVDITEHDPAINIGDAIVVAAEHAVGVRDTDARFAAEVAQRAEHIVERAVGAGRRQASIIRRRQ